MDLSACEIRKYLDQIKSSKWLGLAVHLQRTALSYRSTKAIEYDRKKCQIIRVTVVADEDGNPIFWTEPECTNVFPVKNALSFFEKL